MSGRRSRLVRSAQVLSDPRDCDCHVRTMWDPGFILVDVAAFHGMRHLANVPLYGNHCRVQRDEQFNRDSDVRQTKSELKDASRQGVLVLGCPRDLFDCSELRQQLHDLVSLPRLPRHVSARCNGFAVGIRGGSSTDPRTAQRGATGPDHSYSRDDHVVPVHGLSVGGQKSGQVRSKPRPCHRVRRLNERERARRNLKLRNIALWRNSKTCPTMS